MFRFFCSYCGKRLKADNSHSGKRLRCPNCSETIVVPNAPNITDVQCPSLRRQPTQRPIESSPYLSLRPQFERDLEDSLIFLKEVLIVLWRVNPVGTTAHVFLQLFGSVDEHTTPDQKAALVSEAIANIELIDPEKYRKEFGDGISDLCHASVSETIASAERVYPQIKDFLTSCCKADIDALATDFSRMTSNAIAKQDGYYTEIYNRYLQIVQFHPRYMEIMSRTGLLDMVIGFAAGFFGGYVGFVGAEIWSNWRDADDEEFCQKFFAALEHFAQTCAKFINDGEKALSVVFDRLCEQIRAIEHRVFDAYAKLESAGWDIAPLYQSYRYVGEPFDDDTTQLFKLALGNLEENSAVGYSTIKNIRDMMRLG